MPRRFLIHAAVILLLLLTMALTGRAQAADGCKRIEVGPDTPTGIAGCQRLGAGIASHWQGPGAAVNSCTYPWNDCPTLRVKSLQTGLEIIVTPTMFCDCYTGTADERLIDLDPLMVAALGLDLEQGLYPVRVSLYDGLPDTALAGQP